MKTVGHLLKTAREKKELTLLDVEKATKIRTKYINALENDKYDLLPSGTYAKGFIKNYAQFLNLPVKTLLAVFRRDFTENEQGQIIPRSMTSPISEKKIIWNPKHSLITIISLVVVLVVGFIYYQYQTLTHPRLEITVPQQNEILIGPYITVSGITDPSSVISINGQLAVIDPNGSFSSTIEVPFGKNEVTIEASNTYGYKTIIKRQIEVRKP